MRSKKKKAEPYLFLFLSITWTWFFWFAGVLLGQNWLSFPTIILFIAGGLGPFSVALILIKLGFWEGNLKDFLYNCFHPKSLPWPWYLKILVLVLVLTVLPLVFASIIFQETFSELLRWNTPVPFLIVGALAGAIEEPGWRGYAQKAMENKMPVLWGSLVIGVFWALWHLPLFFMPGTFQAEIGFGTPGFFLFNLALLVASPIYGWLFKATGGVAFGAVFYHAMGNLFRELLSFKETGWEIDLINFAFEALIALFIIAFAWKIMLKKPSNQ